MKSATGAPYQVNAIAQFHTLMQLPAPQHPLISIIHFEAIKHPPQGLPKSIMLNFYSIWLKKNFIGKMKYGQNEYDFDAGLMSFFSPGQVITPVGDEAYTHTGWWLMIHPDFLWGHVLAKKTGQYKYFSYAVNEALHLSAKEEVMMAEMLTGIEQEHNTAIDDFSQPIIIARIELLFNYADRFYNRQFITRKIINHSIAGKVNEALDEYLSNNNLPAPGLPTVKYLAQQLNMSANYLSDVLKKHTGLNAQQHIQNKLVEKGKEKLSTTSMTVNEIAFQLGFEHSQSFNKLFKSKTTFTPLQFRQSFN